MKETVIGSIFNVNYSALTEKVNEDIVAMENMFYYVSNIQFLYLADGFVAFITYQKDLEN